MQAFLPRQRQLLATFLAVLVAAACLLPGTARAVENPQSGNLNVNGQVADEAPSSPAVIEQPIDGQHFDHSVISTLGSCPNGSFVEIYKNGIFAGVAQCQSGRFSLSISLVPGKNVLVARVRNVVDNYGPDSSPVTVFYDVSATSSNPAVAAAAKFPALVVTTDRLYLGTFINKPMALKVTIIGGSKPYAVSTDWGDGSSSLLPRDAAGEFSLQNTYAQPGNHIIKITVTDSNQQTATVQTLAVINGEIAQVTPTSVIRSTYSRLFESLLTILGLLLIIILAFYLGYEWRRRQEERRARQLRPMHHPRPQARRS